MELQENEKLKARLNEEARIFAYAIDPKQWKSWTPLLRREGYLAGSKAQLIRTIILIDQLIQENGDSEKLKKLHKLILDIE